MDYLRQIGIDVEIQEVTRAEMIDKALNHTSLGLRADVYSMENGAVAPLDTYWSKNGWRPNKVVDPVFDEYYENARAATTVEQQQEWARKADLRVAEQLWMIRGPRAPTFGATQPWLKGYNGEVWIDTPLGIFQYLWIDQDLKREMGN